MIKPSFFWGMGCVLLLLTACSTMSRVKLDPVKLQKVNLTANADANEGKPVVVDIVFAFDKATLKTLEGFNASGWFDVKNTSLGNWNNTAVWKSVTVAPGAREAVTEFPERYEKAVAVIIYANYRQPGLHRLILTQEQNVNIELRDRGFAADAGRQYLLSSPPETPRPDRQAGRY